MSALFSDTPPPPVAAEAVRVFACGGLGEIGRNMLVVQTADDAIVIDCGVLFPTADTPGVDLILPDLSILDQAGVQPKHVILTHGHEDHIGALPYLLKRRPNVALVGSRLTLGLASAKLREHGLRPEFVEVHDGDERNFGRFKIKFLAVTHSVPDGFALDIQVGGMRILHTGDFKLDTRPLDGRRTDLTGFASAGQMGVDLLLSDSTNADVPGHLPGERDITSHLRRVFSEAPGRVIFACFASNVHRVQQAIDSAVASGRTFALVGRSMVRNMGIAAELGFLNIPVGSQVSFEDLVKAEPREVAIICTGSQGEPLSALARMAREEHKIKLMAQDLVVLSARLIPGNETDIFRVVNDLSKRGVTVMHRDNAPVHASGHAPAGELAQVLLLAKPRYLLPIHGEWRHLQAHAAIARDAGLTEDEVLLVGNGVAVDLARGVALVTGVYPHTDIYVDGATVGLVGPKTLRERRQLATSGVVTAVLIVDSFSGELLRDPIIEIRGFPAEGFAVEEAARLVQDQAAEWASGDVHDQSQLEQTVKRKLARWVRDTYAVQPVIVCSVVDTAK